MAAFWIKMRTDLASDPAVIAIADACGLDEYGVVGRLHKLWSWADSQTYDGNAVGVTKKWIDRYIDVTGFADQMVKCGWLIFTEVNGISQMSIPKFDRHNGQSAKRRALTSKRVADHRGQECNADSVTGALPEEKRGDVEEKREEEKREELPDLSAGSEDNTHSAGKPAKRAPKAYSPTFEAFWAAYPRKVGKEFAAKAFEAAAKRQTLATGRAIADERQWLIDAALAFAATPSGQAGQFVPYPSTWLNQSRFLDDRGEWQRRREEKSFTTHPHNDLSRYANDPDAGKF